MASAPTRQHKRVTISDVAREAGVSIAAVSRILNNSYDGFSAREETKQRVFDAVQRLGYRPSRAAVRLATGRHNAIGLSFPVKDTLDAPIDTHSLSQVFSHFDLMLVQHGIVRALKAHNMDLVVMPRYTSRSTREFINQAQETVDGIVWINPRHDAEELGSVVESGVKLAIVGPAPVSGEFVNVRTDETMAGRMAMGHLIVCKTRRILVAVPEARKQEQATVERVEGVGKAVADFTDPELGYEVVTFSSDAKKARAAFRRHVEKRGAPDGVLTLGDHLPLSIMAELQHMGLRIPQDARMVGFEENLTFVMTNPQITGLRYPIEEMCHQATTMLLDYVRDGSAPKPVYFTPQLIARASCH